MSKKRLTLKQQKFVKKFVETGNATEAALESYNVKSKKNAQLIGYQQLEKEPIQIEVQKALAKNNITLDNITSNINRIANETDIRPTADTVLKANEHLLKLFNAFPERVQKIQSLNIKTELSQKNFQDLINLHRKKSKELEEILGS